MNKKNKKATRKSFPPFVVACIVEGALSMRNNLNEKTLDTEKAQRMIDDFLLTLGYEYWKTYHNEVEANAATVEAKNVIHNFYDFYYTFF